MIALSIFYGLAALTVLAALVFGIWALLIMPRRNDPALPRFTGKLYAHRGFHDKPAIPENSLAAFRRARDNGFGAELDVHLAKDGGLAVIHDESLLRTCGAEGLVAEKTLAELSEYRLEGTDERIPTFAEMLSVMDKGPLVIELKSYKGNHNALTHAVMRALSDYKGDYCIESFDPRVLFCLKKHYPDVVRGQLSADMTDKSCHLSLPVGFLLKNMLQNFLTRPDFIAFNIQNRYVVSFRLIKKLYRPAIFYWTVSDKDQQRICESEGATMIFERFDPRD